MKSRSLLFFTLVLALISCKKDKPEQGKAIITIEGITISKPPASGARILATENWEHPYAASYSLTFISQETSERYSVAITTDFENAPPRIELPLGSYSYESSPSPELISEFLPIQFGGNLQVNASQVTAKLQGVSDYQLISFQKQNISQAPKILLPSQGTMKSSGQHYYLYVKSGLLSKTEISLSNGLSFRYGKDASAFSHRHFSLVKQSGDPEPIAISDPLFELQNATLSLKDNLFPDQLFPFSKEDLPTQLKENSGLQWLGNRLFTFNDGGNPAEIFEINPETGAILRTIQIGNSTNVDWEDMAANATHLFIGDFGNNSGNRKDLKILKIPISDVLNQISVTAEEIKFSYPDQTQFDQANHRFDCEAMAFWGGKLHLFTKATDSNETKEYTLDPNAGTQVAGMGTSFTAPGKLTGLDISPDGKNLAFIGYTVNGLNSNSFLLVFPGFESGSPLSSQTKYAFTLENVSQSGQTEGISILSSEKIKISGEQISISGFTIPPRLMELDLKGIFED